MRKFVMLPLMALLMVIGLSACGHSTPVSYAPVSYGEYGHCYYVDDPYEVTILQQQGRCQSSWTPMLMPILWHQMYYPYYSSPGYVSTFVLVSHRTTYVTQEKSFGNTYKSQISSASKTAKYKGSDGKIVTGNKVNSKNVSGGSRSTGNSGSRTKTCSLGPITTSAGLLYKGGGGSRSGGSTGGSRGGSTGGSRSKSGGSSSGSTTGKKTC